MKKYDLSKFFAVYSLLAFVMLVFGLTHNMIAFHNYLKNIFVPITIITVTLRITAAFACMVLTNILRSFFCKELSGLLNKMSEQASALEKMSCRLDYESTARIVRVYVVTTFFFVLLFVSYDIWLALEKYGVTAIVWTIWLYAIIAQTMNLTILASLVLCVGIKLRSVNERIETVVTRANASSPKVVVTTDVCAENLRALSRAHYNICTIGKGINHFFNVDLIITVVIAFVTLSTTLYFIFYEVRRDGETNFRIIFSYIHWELLHSIPIIMIVFSCNWTSNQAMQAGILIHEIRVEKTDSRLYEAIKSFSLQLHHQKLEFSAAGFFPLNSTLLQTMMGSITTNLVILIQFEPKLD